MADGQRRSKADLRVVIRCAAA
ncbi:hypothetical protein [Methylobacterium mesophilicum]